MYECDTAIHLIYNDLTNRIHQWLHHQAGHFMLSNIRRVRQTKKGNSHKESRTMKHNLSCTATVPCKASVQTSSVQNLGNSLFTCIEYYLYCNFHCKKTDKTAVSESQLESASYQRLQTGKI